MNRRHALKVIGGAFGAAVAATVLRPLRADAACPKGTTKCGTACCSNNTEVCSQGKSSCCCPASSTPCGPACCSSGVACVNANKGICGCPSGYTQCVSGGVVTCCAAGKACTSGCPTAASLETTVKNCHAGRVCDCVVNGPKTCLNGAIVGCANNSCFCWLGIAGNTFCGGNGNIAACASDADCPSGYACIVCDGTCTCPVNGTACVIRDGCC